MKTRRSLSHALMALPAVGVAAVWLALWLLWPSFDAMSGARRQKVLPSRIVFMPASVTAAAPHLRPDAFARPSAREAATFGDESVPERATETFRLRPKMLKPGAGRFSGAEGLDSKSGGRDIEYLPAWSVADPFGRPPASTGLAVTVSGELRDAGFRLPELHAGDVRQTGTTWEVVFAVEAGGDGKVASVFVRSASGAGEVVAALERWLYRGRCPGSGVPVRGDVTVGWAGR